MGKKLKARILTSGPLTADLVWFCVPDGAIRATAHDFAERLEWRSKYAFHSSGALASDELDDLSQRGARVASLHPMMTFVRGSVPSLEGVSFALEGDPAAVRMARRIVRDLGGRAFSILPRNKAAYHAWGGFCSPLLVALLTTGEQVARLAGLSAHDARKKMLPIVQQTMANYAELGPAGAFSGPLLRGDVEVVRKHLRTLKEIPQAQDIYVALARAALHSLPTRNRADLKKALGRT